MNISRTKRAFELKLKTIFLVLKVLLDSKKKEKKKKNSKNISDITFKIRIEDTRTEGQITGKKG